MINFQIPVNDKVELKIFDLLGWEVEVLVNSFTEAGFHQVTFDAQDLASGMYIY